jgi:hypothetical protein
LDMNDDRNYPEASAKIQYMVKGRKAPEMGS